MFQEALMFDKALQTLKIKSENSQLYSVTQI